MGGGGSGGGGGGGGEFLFLRMIRTRMLLGVLLEELCLREIRELRRTVRGRGDVIHSTMPLVGSVRACHIVVKNYFTPRILFGCVVGLGKSLFVRGEH